MVYGEYKINIRQGYLLKTKYHEHKTYFWKITSFGVEYR